MLRPARVVATIALSLVVGSALAAEPTGIWLTANGKARVRIAPCGSAYCGTVVWVAGDDKDVYNPDPAKRSRSTVGQQIIFGMTESGDDYKGTLYNAQDGRTYRGKLEMLDERCIKLSECVLGGLICRSQVWTRAE